MSEEVYSTTIPGDRAREVNLTIAAAAIISALLVLLLLWKDYQSNQLLAEQLQENIQHQTLSTSLRQFDQTLTMSASSAAATGHPAWKARYDALLPQFDATIQAATLPETQLAVGGLTAAHTQLAEMEARLFRLVAQENLPAALAILNSADYIAQKSQIATHLDELSEMLTKKAEASLATNDARRQQIGTILAVLLLLLAVIWVFVHSVVQRWRQNLMNRAQELQQLAHYDELTGIANRSLFRERLIEALSRSRRFRKPVALLLLDLDDFKEINDQLGHPVGDKLLKSVAERLNTNRRLTDTVARLGGDEFAIILTDLTEEDAATVASRILDQCSQALEIDTHTIVTHASIGISLSPNDATDEDELLRKADMALYMAKNAGRNTYAYYDEELERATREKQHLQVDIKRGIEANEFELHYQPLMDLRSGKVYGAEALLRWEHPERGNLSPAAFIAVAESSHLIVPLGSWVLKEACRQQVAWVALGLEPISVSVNISAVQFNDKSLFRSIQEALSETGIDPAYLTLEITESTIMEDVGAVIETLNHIEALGIKLSIDDFGTGYSSLGYLTRFPVSQLKIDRSFVRHLPTDSGDVAIAQAIIQMGKALGMDIVAEGIETEEQLEFLKQERCERGQGYYFSKPIPAEELAQWLLPQQPHSIKQIAGAIVS